MDKGCQQPATMTGVVHARARGDDVPHHDEGVDMDTTENRYSPRPAFSIEIEGKQLTALDNRLISLSLTDNRGFEADQLDLELDDADGQIVLPRRGAVIQLALGWKGQPLFPKGAFTVDEIEHSGAPDRLTIRARSADFVKPSTPGVKSHGTRQPLAMW